MNRPNLTLAFVSLWCAAPQQLAVAAAEPKPNFVIVFADDQGYGDLGCFGSQRIETPKLDAEVEKTLARCGSSRRAASSIEMDHYAT